MSLTPSKFPLAPRIFVDSAQRYIVLGVVCRTGELVQLPTNARAWRRSNWQQFTALSNCKDLSRQLKTVY